MLVVLGSICIYNIKLLVDTSNRIRQRYIFVVFQVRIPTNTPACDILTYNTLQCLTLLQYISLYTCWFSINMVLVFLDKIHTVHTVI